MEESGPRTDRAVALDDLARIGADLELDLPALTRNPVCGCHVSITVQRGTAASYSGRQAS
jgi:hypothetical protein